MAKKKTAVLTVAELEQLLDSRRSELATLKEKREALANQIADLDEQIAAATGTGGGRKKVKRVKRKKSAKRAAKKAVRKTARKVKKTRPTTRRKRAKNSAPLSTFVEQALAGNKKGLTVQQIVDAVKKAGYKSKSANFNTVVYQQLYHSKKIKKAGRGMYALK